jgi:hypothetical protein
MQYRYCMAVKLEVHGRWIGALVGLFLVSSA